MTPKRLVLTIDTVTPSLNEHLHWAAYGRVKAALQTKITEALYAASAASQTPLSSLIMRGQCKAELEVTSYRHAILDHDNLVGGAKPLIDALRDLKLIVDDKPEWLVATYDCRVDRKNKRTSIVLEWDEDEARAQRPKPAIPLGPVVEVPKASIPHQLNTKTTTEEPAMFSFVSQTAEIRSMHIQDRVDGDGRTIEVSVRLQLGCTLEDGDLDSLPHVAEAVKSLLRSSRAQDPDSGPNTVTVSIKRTIPPCRYALTHDLLSSSFVGLTVLQPKILIVEGSVGMIWSVETNVNVNDLPMLASLVGMDDLELKSHPLQGDLFEAVA